MGASPTYLGNRPDASIISSGRDALATQGLNWIVCSVSCLHILPRLPSHSFLTQQPFQTPKCNTISSRQHVLRCSGFERPHNLSYLLLAQPISDSPLWRVI